MQRSSGQGHLIIQRAGNRNVPERIFQQGCAKIRFPAMTAGPMEAVLINTSGGLTGGDRLQWRVEAGAAAQVSATTPAFEKIYRAGPQGVARVDTRIEAASGAHVAWLPQETLMFEGGALERRIDADLAADASLLAVEAVVLGRTARGETVRSGRFRDSWRVRRGGVLIHAEETRLEGDMAGMGAPAAALGGMTAFATVLLVGDGLDPALADTRRLLHRCGGQGAASVWRIGRHGKLLARLVAKDGYELRQALVPLLGLLMKQARQVGELPRIWSI